jgi:pyridoxamine 5'-phosphate oxidase
MSDAHRSLDPDAIRQFRRWWAEAVRARAGIPNAVTLATATRAGVPSARTVLFRGIRAGGFLFFTNYRSPKALAIAGNPRAVLVFHWAELDRQVVVEGSVRKATAAESDRYFRSRPRGNRLAAWASPQSAEIPDRAFLEGRFAEVRRRYRGRDVPRPPFWGGFRLVPTRIEFWQGGRHRLHDRHRYLRRGTKWERTRLAP